MYFMKKFIFLFLTIVLYFSFSFSVFASFDWSVNYFDDLKTQYITYANGGSYTYFILEDMYYDYDEEDYFFHVSVYNDYANGNRVSVLCDEVFYSSYYFPTKEFKSKTPLTYEEWESMKTLKELREPEPDPEPDPDPDPEPIEDIEFIDSLNNLYTICCFICFGIFCVVGCLVGTIFINVLMKI